MHKKSALQGLISTHARISANPVLFELRMLYNDLSSGAILFLILTSHLSCG